MANRLVKALKHVEFVNSWFEYCQFIHDIKNSRATIKCRKLTTQLFPSYFKQKWKGKGRNHQKVNINKRTFVLSILKY